MRHSAALVRSTIGQALAALLLAAGVASAQPPADAGVEFFEKQVRPILAGRCFGCHSGKLDEGVKEPKGNLRLDSREALLQGGDTGPAIVPGKPGESLLIDAINYGELYQMPPKSKLPAEEIAALTKWVEMGAPWPRGAAAAPRGERDFDLAARMAEHWCWQPLKAVQPPPVRDAAWPRQPLDRFILARLEEKGIAPAPPADKRTLIRRAYFDLIGLPPPPDAHSSALASARPTCAKTTSHPANRARGTRLGCQRSGLCTSCEGRVGKFAFLSWLDIVIAQGRKLLIEYPGGSPRVGVLFSAHPTKAYLASWS
jgi:hypothetical protein